MSYRSGPCWRPNAEYNSKPGTRAWNSLGYKDFKNRISTIYKEVNVQKVEKQGPIEL